MLCQEFNASKRFLKALFMAAMVSAILAHPGRCETLTVPIFLDQQSTIEAIEITAVFDENVLDAVSIALEGGILEQYDLSANITAEGEIRLTIYGGDLITGSGPVVFVSFDVLEDGPDASALSLTEFRCNTLPASGGFDVKDALCQNVQIIAGPDISNDGKVGLQDAVSVLQVIAGEKSCYLGDISLKKAILALQIVSGSKLQNVIPE